MVYSRENYPEGISELKVGDTFHQEDGREYKVIALEDFTIVPVGAFPDSFKIPGEVVYTGSGISRKHGLRYHFVQISP